MAQINLLKQKSPVTNSLNFLVSLLTKFFALLAFSALVYYAWTYVRVLAVEKEIPKIQSRIAEKKKEALGLSERSELFTRQAQLKEFENLLGAHRYVSNLLPEIAKVTLKSGSYNGLTLSEDNTLTLSITLPNLTEVDKFLQVFDYPQFNENFTDVRVGSISKVQKDEVNTYDINFHMKFNPKLTKFSQ